MVKDGIGVGALADGLVGGTLFTRVVSRELAETVVSFRVSFAVFSVSFVLTPPLAIYNLTGPRLVELDVFGVVVASLVNCYLLRRWVTPAVQHWMADTLSNKALEGPCDRRLQLHPIIPHYDP